MTKHPRDPNPDPPGGRAAERLREFIDQRFPADDRPPDPSAEDDAGEEPENETDEDDDDPDSEKG